ncbi:nuclear transport factor 2 family protein [Alkalimonas amylolytica]|uniref:SnoaL-like domain-containing protein n=1 Tax=Alkalimonas amylolytica TaxID=152573 RepID=A0A1H4DA17_ALKAM|nr:nuclear transport factor 2 family protein [Alkalimonas amylolytica]SEA69239.1 SnoaL-like domain-containing protein [Alkalimonas amylolytica]
MAVPSCFVAAIAVLTLTLSAALLETQAEETGVDAPVRALITAMAAEDAEQIRAQFSPDATQAYGADGQMKSAAATARWLESDIIGRNGKVVNPEYIINGNEVIVRGQFRSRGYSSEADFLFTVEHGLITSWRIRY